MALGKYRLKLSKTNEKKEGIPRYSLTYKPGARRISRVSHEVLSTLIGEHDVMIEMSTDLLFGPRGKEQASVAGFLERINAFPVTCADRKVLSNRKNIFFGITFDKKKKEMAHEAAVYVPNAVWREASFADVIPIHGAWYYVVKEPADAETAVNGFWAMGDDQKEDTFLLSVFDIAMLGQAGIDAKLEEEALRGMLGL